MKEFSAEKRTEWQFITPASPHHNGCAEALVKIATKALKTAIGEQILTPFEQHTCLMAAANLMNPRLIGRISNDPDDRCFLCPNDNISGRASAMVPHGPFQETKNPRHHVEFIQKIIDSFWKRWHRDVFPSLVPRKKWKVERRNGRVDDIVVVQHPNAVRGKRNTDRIVNAWKSTQRKGENSNLVL